ncbi:MAG: aspartate carbamoyltransferase [Verrucomicrobia bacterium RIFCSPHIGHO2_12_FULL_41_10]|nr:MAG: aspartate carbamoyltransferase [Verrucomicrobia bacterium RIFCSPHIGHO2_12_FULL_41_10]
MLPPKEVGSEGLHWQHKDLCSLADLSPSEIRLILDTATKFSKSDQETKDKSLLEGKTVTNLFIEPSTRTRISFELAAKRLGADVVTISATSSSIEKGESLLDTARNIEALHTDIIVLRHQSSGSARFLADRLKASVINAGDGAHEHPTQGLLDLFTIHKKLGRIEGLKVAIVGDILFSRVARSNIQALTKLGAEVILVGPATLVPETFSSLGVKIAHSIDEILSEVDVINILRIQQERQKREYFPGLKEYTSLFGLTQKRAQQLRPECLIMHPGPINRGIEIDSDVANSDGSVILEQVTNGLAIRMAVLTLCAL